MWLPPWILDISCWLLDLGTTLRRGWRTSFHAHQAAIPVKKDVHEKASDLHEKAWKFFEKCGIVLSYLDRGLYYDTIIILLDHYYCFRGYLLATSYESGSHGERCASTKGLEFAPFAHCVELL
jgi:hypothetical protein